VIVAVVMAVVTAAMMMAAAVMALAHTQGHHLHKQHDCSWQEN
jgi:hypothetical protein